MKQFTAVLRRAGLQVDKTLVTVESLHEVADETTVPIPLFFVGFTGPEIGRVTRLWVEDDELRGVVELDDVSEVPDAAADPRPPASG